jgi:hypothetical protein
MTTTQKFNPKVYGGKPRLYAAVPRAPRISRLWVWDKGSKEYRTPPQGKCYMAKRKRRMPLAFGLAGFSFLPLSMRPEASRRVPIRNMEMAITKWRKVQGCDTKTYSISTSKA